MPSDRTFNRKNAPVRYETLRECMYNFRRDYGIAMLEEKKPVFWKLQMKWGEEYEGNSFGSTCRKIRDELKLNPHGYVNENHIRVHGRGTSATRLHENDDTEEETDRDDEEDAGDDGMPDIGSGPLKPQKGPATSTSAPFGAAPMKLNKNTKLNPHTLAPEDRVFSNQGHLQLPYYAVLHLDQPDQTGDQRKLSLHVCIHCLSGTTDGGFEVDINPKDRSQMIFQDQMGESGKIFFGQESITKGYEGFNNSEHAEQSIAEMVTHLTSNYKNPMAQKQVLRFPFRLRGWLDGVKPWASSVPFQPFEEVEAMESMAFVNCIAIVDWDDVETSRTSAFRKTTAILKSPRFTRFEGSTNHDRCDSLHSTPRHDNMGATILELDGLSLCDEDYERSSASHNSMHSSGRKSVPGNRSTSGGKSQARSLGSKQSRKGLTRKAPEYPFTISIPEQDDSSGITEMHDDYARRSHSLSASARSVSMPVRRSPAYFKTPSSSQSVSHPTKTSPARSLKPSSHHSNKSCSSTISWKEADNADETQTLDDPNQVIRTMLGSCSSSNLHHANEEEHTAFASILTRSMTAPGQGLQRKGKK